MHQQLTSLLLMGLFSTLFGCQGDKSKAQGSAERKDAGLEEITARIDPAEGWGDVFLKVVDVTQTDSTRIYTARGLSNGVPVGLRFEVRTDIGAGLVGGKPTQSGVVGNAVRIRSIGLESDHFLKALALLYRQSVPMGFTTREIVATAFSLNHQAVDLDRKDQYKLKLFFAEEDEELQSELYFNIDTDKGEIELAEKDESNREPLIKVFSN
jgi:hypothetical protein